MKTRAYIIISFFLFAGIFVMCSKEQEKEDIILKVGDKKVTTKEYRYRAELTPHPSYPELEKTFLNNLIMEKIFALEGEESELRQNKNFQAYIKGVKEQEMRKQLFYEKAFNPVKLDTNEIKQQYRNSLRVYDVEFYTFHRDEIAERVQAELQARPDSAVSVFNSIWKDEKRPTKTVKYRDPDNLNIHETLFDTLHDVNEVMGPIKLESNKWIFMKVADWRDEPIIGGEEVARRWNQVKEKMTMNKATRAWHKYMYEVMKDKDIEFNKDTFLKLADLSFDLEMANNEAEEQDVLNRFSQQEDSTLTISDLPNEEAILQAPFFTIDGVTWTVGEFRAAVASHPLVYRNRTTDRNQFYHEFKVAVADLMRDHYLTKEAYKIDLDKDIEVQRVASMWEDALVGMYERDQALKRIASTLPDTLKVGRQYQLSQKFESFMDSLRVEYSNEIKVNYATYDSLEINDVPMFVMQQQVPYPVVVPNWPVYTNRKEVDFNALDE